MATPAVSTESGVQAGSEEDVRAEGAAGQDPKGDGKRRKFKPLEAMRKFFKGGRKRSKSKDEQVSIVSMKAKSTTALYGQNSEDDDDDGGFASQTARPTPLHDKRSISEDSVFSPEHHETNLEGLKKTAISEENIHKSPFQAELFSKIKKRQSQCSDEDDGLPQSPTPPVTTADIIMGGGLKPLPVAGKSTSRESDKSLISVDGSENEDDDPFQVRWKSSVPAMASRRRDSSPGPETSSEMDFEAVQSTQVLSSEASKHKISIKPKSRRSRQSRKKRDVTPTGGLPSLNEESPSKVLAEDSNEDAPASPTEKKLVEMETAEKSSTLIVTAKAGETPKVAMTTSEQPSSKATRAEPEHPSSPPATSPSAVSSYAAKRMSGSYMPLPPVSPSASETKAPAPVAAAAAPLSPTAKSHTPAPAASSQDASSKTAVAKPGEKPKEEPGKANELSQIFNKIKRQSTVMDEPAKPPAESEMKVEPKGTIIQVHAGGGSGGGSDKVVEDKPRKNSVQALESVPVAGGPAPASSLNSSVAPMLPPRESKEKSVVFESPKMQSEGDKVSGKTTSEDVRRDRPEQVPVALAGTPSQATSVQQGADSSTPPGPSPRDDYKQRRQARSKTLPEHPILKEETSPVKVQRAASHRLTTPPSSSPPSPRHPLGQVTPTSGRPEPKRWSTVEGETSGGTEPAWMAMVRRRKAGKEEGEESKPEEAPAAPAQQTSTSPALKDFAHQRSKSVKVSSKPAEDVGFTLPGQDGGKSFSPSVSPMSSPSRSAVKPAKTEESSSDVPKPVWSSSKPTVAKAEEKPAEPQKPARTVNIRQEPFKAEASHTETAKPVAISTVKHVPAKTEEPAPEVSKFSRSASLKPNTKAEEPVVEAPKPFRGASVKPTFPKKEESEAPKAAWSSSSIKAPAPKIEETPEPTKTLPSSVGSAKPSISSAKPSLTTRSITPAAQPAKDTTTTTPASVPSWKSSSLKKKDNSNPLAPVKIEIIENTTPPITPRSPDKPTAPVSPEKSSDKCHQAPSGRGSSKVLDMVKNFQKLQVS